MKYKSEKICASIVLICLMLFASCLPVCDIEIVETPQPTPQPTFYFETEKHIIFIPKGCEIGDIVAPEDGIFIGKSRIIDMRIIEVPVKKKQKKIRTQGISTYPRIPDTVDTGIIHESRENGKIHESRENGKTGLSTYPDYPGKRDYPVNPGKQKKQLM